MLSFDTFKSLVLYKIFRNTEENQGAPVTEHHQLSWALK